MLGLVYGEIVLEPPLAGLQHGIGGVSNISTSRYRDVQFSVVINQVLFIDRKLRAGHYDVDITATTDGDLNQFKVMFRSTDQGQIGKHQCDWSVPNRCRVLRHESTIQMGF